MYTREMLPYVLSSVSDAVKEAMAFSLDELLHHCTYSKNICPKKKFLKKLDPDYGCCYTFNGDPTNVLEVTRAGENDGLELYMNVNQQQYLGFSESAGFIFYIHEQNDTVITFNGGIKISAGMHVTIGISKVSQEIVYRQHCISTQI